MCCDKTSDNCINYLHDRPLMRVYNNNVSTFEKLLEKDNSVKKIHVKDLRILPPELHKTKGSLAVPIMHEGFEQRNVQYKLRSQTGFKLGPVKTVNCGLRALKYLGPKIRNIVYRNMEYSSFSD